MSEILSPPISTETALSLINKIVSVLNQTIDLDTSIDLALRELADHFNLATAAVLTYTPQNGIKVAASIGIRIDTISQFSTHINLNEESVAYTPIKNQIIHAITDVPTDDAEKLADPYLRLMRENGEKKAVLIPLIKDGIACGVYVLHGICNQSFSDANKELFLTIGNQIALTIERFHLIQIQKEALQQAQALRETGIILSQSLDLDHILDQALQQIQRVVPFDTATVAQIRNGRTQIIRAHGYNHYGSEVERLAWSLSFEIEKTPNIKRICDTGKPIIIQNTHTDPEWIHSPMFSYIHGWIGAPIYVNSKVVAFIFLDKQESHFYTNRHAEALEAFAAQLSLSLQNARLFDEKNRHANTLAALNELMHTITGYHTVREVCMTTADQVTNMFGHLNTIILLYQSATQDFIVEGFAGIEDKQWKLGQPNTSEIALNALMNGRLNLIEDLWEQAAGPPLAGSSVVRSVCAIPLQIGREKIGALLIEHTRPGAFRQENISILETIADQLAQSIQKARLIEDSTRDAAEMDALYKTSAAIRDAKTIIGISSSIVKQCSYVFQSSGSSLMLITEDGHLRITGVHPPRPDSLGAIYPKGRGVVGHVANTRQMYIAEDVPTDPLTYRPKGDSPRFTGARTSISTPLQNNERLIGVLNIWYKDTHIFEPREIRFLSTVADIATNALERGLLLENLEQRITARTQELESANLRLHELDQLKSKFITEITHELRTPIANLNLYFDLLGRGQEAKREKYMGILRKQVDRLEDLVNNAISVSRLDLEKESSKFIQIDFNELVRGVIDSLDLSQKGHLKWYTQFEPLIAPIGGDPADLTEMVKQIIKNSIDYTTEGSITVTITIAETQDHLRFCVEDTGQGIPDADLPYVFDRFYRSMETTNVAGAGLGLALVKEIVALHQGSVQIESKEGLGTHICVELPMLSTNDPL